jgi:hypothetical protein
MQAICAVTSKQQTTYLVAGHSIVVETQDAWAATAIAELFPGWYLTPGCATKEELSLPAIVIRSSASPPQVQKDWDQFEIAGGGTCYSDGQTSYIDIEGSIVAIDKPGFTAVEVWANGPLDLQSPALTRVVTYALAAALRRRRLFESAQRRCDPSAKRPGSADYWTIRQRKSIPTVQLATAGWSF